MTVPRITGNAVFDVIGIICTVLVLAFLGWVLMGVAGLFTDLFTDWRASRRSVRPVVVAPAAPEVASPAAKKRRSPFAPKQKEGTK